MWQVRDHDGRVVVRRKTLTSAKKNARELSAINPNRAYFVCDSTGNVRVNHMLPETLNHHHRR